MFDGKHELLHAGNVMINLNNIWRNAPYFGGHLQKKVQIEFLKFLFVLKSLCNHYINFIFELLVR